MADTSDSESDELLHSQYTAQLQRPKMDVRETGSTMDSNDEDSGDDLISQISKDSVVRTHPRANNVTESDTGNCSTFIDSNIMPVVSDDAFKNTTYNVKDPKKNLVYNIPRELFVHAPSFSISGTALSRIDICMSKFMETQVAQRLAVVKSLVRDYGLNYITERLMFVKLHTKPQSVTAFLPVRISDEKSNQCVQALQDDNGVALFSVPKQVIISFIQQSDVLPREFAPEAGKWTVQNTPYTRESALAWNKIYPPSKRNNKRNIGEISKDPEQPVKRETADSTSKEWNAMHSVVDSRVTKYYEPPRSEAWKLKGLCVPAGVSVKVKIELTPQDADK